MADQNGEGALSVVAFAGSLREASFNRALLRAALELSPTELGIEIIEIGDLPFYDADLEAKGDPAAVRDFKERIRAADGILIATPEYNEGIPSVLTAAIEWASRLPGRAPITGKPVALMGASMSMTGTARGQTHLRQLLHHLNARPLPPPELLIARAQDKFDAGLRLTDDAARKILDMLLRRFARWILRERAARRVDAELAAAAQSQMGSEAAAGRG